ncbi:hypothetical protein EV580_6573 [Mycobacterium sp. BK086]|uniref:hypothetical protein n=1 Tax=Mycobacterium sp. BK086 TaxID=2512165 RepID=UPI0010E812AC|nr:hypothetical protein [Mycobacterium sp. BK086]TDO06482.1 hypothetical protein EV580_6573 [Mycobacterium sp. BK086]
MSGGPEQGVEYAAYLKDQLAREYSRRDQVNSRAATAITSATGLATLATGIFALILGKDFTLKGAALTSMAAALLAFLAAAVFAVIAGLNRTYDAVDEATMRSLLSAEHWKDNPIDARWQTANFTILSVTTLRTGTNFKYRFLALSGIAQIVAILALGVCAIAVFGWE